MIHLRQPVVNTLQSPKSTIYLSNQVRPDDRVYYFQDLFKKQVTRLVRHDVRLRILPLPLPLPLPLSLSLSLSLVQYGLVSCQEYNIQLRGAGSYFISYIFYPLSFILVFAFLLRTLSCYFFLSLSWSYIVLISVLCWSVWAIQTY